MQFEKHYRKYPLILQLKTEMKISYKELTMFTLTEICHLFAKLDAAPDQDVDALEKFLRNLTQRLHLPPDDQKGRVFLYEPASVAAIRLAYFASRFGLDRIMIDEFTRWLHGAGTRKEKKVTGGYRGVPIVGEAIDRTRAGEHFRFHVIMTANRQIICHTDWRVEPMSDRAARALERRPRPVEVGRYTSPASDLIAELLLVGG